MSVGAADPAVLPFRPNRTQTITEAENLTRHPPLVRSFFTDILDTFEIVQGLNEI